MGIKEQFTQEMLNISEISKRECKYNPIRFITMIQEKGGQETAKSLLLEDTPQEGLFKLWEFGRLEISMEALVLKPEFRPLFTQDEIEQARKRLSDLNFHPTWDHL